ncbi:MAG: hypothetical protein Q9168_001209 [Polycauliona sp. 1 TL-2023]
MGRLNYTNRKTEGLKLGQSIAKDLIKRIPPGTGSKSALRDPVVELDVTGRDLGEHGFREVAAALTTSLEYRGETGRVVLLEELCLKANKLSTACLPALARIIRLSAHELRDLDLSDNTFTITTSNEEDAWQDFLESFTECCVLRRIDLGGNPLGTKVFEILARVYSREPTIELWLHGHAGEMLHSNTSKQGVNLEKIASLEQQSRNLSLVSASDAYSEDDDEDHIERRTSVDEGKAGLAGRHDGKSAEKGQRQSSLPPLAPDYVSTKGLRSVPYLIVANTNMTDAAALQFSYVLACHHLPDRLLKQVPPPKPGHQLQILDAYDNESGCQGLIYLPNEHISSPGHRMLELSENARQVLLDDGWPTQSPDYSQIHFNKSPSSRNPSTTYSISSVPASGSRRRSGTRGEQQELTGSEALHVELDRARSRIQGNILKDIGVQSNGIWRTALGLLAICRILCPRKPPPKEEVQVTIAEEVHISPPPPPPVQDTAQIANDSAFPALPKVRTKPFVGYLDPWAPPLASKSPNIPTTPQPKRQPLKIKTTTPSPFPTGTASPTAVSPKTGGLPVQPYRSELPGGLPDKAWARIMGEHLAADRFMSQTQQRNVLSWAVDRRTLAKEMESLGKPESAQIWKVLEGMGCLAYEGDF